MAVCSKTRVLVDRTNVPLFQPKVHSENSFGFLRLLFASLVIVSHTPEIYDGDRDRELLSIAFGTISFGDLAVDAFFVISGYLITSSFINSSSSRSYMTKRLARIYPGFLFATIICLVIVQPFGGGTFVNSGRLWVVAMARAIMLQSPDGGTVFGGTYYAALNGPMWTVAYEFKCYLFVLVFGWLGLFSRPGWIIAITASLITFSTVFVADYSPAIVDYTLRSPPKTILFDDLLNVVVGDFGRLVRLSAVFFVGCSYFLFRDKLRFTPLNLALAALGLSGSLFALHFAHAGTAIFGGFLILAAAKRVGGGALQTINSNNDISYGVYLYAWPTAKLLLWWVPGIPMVLLGFVTFGVACLCGWFSWHFVERPAMAIVRRRSVKAKSE